jgi:hypothetical protein
LVAVTVTPGRPAPVLSVIRPLIDPDVALSDCANAAVHMTMQSIATNRHRIRLCIQNPPEDLRFLEDRFNGATDPHAQKLSADTLPYDPGSAKPFRLISRAPVVNLSKVP